jgi:hypothetical protein
VGIGAFLAWNERNNAQVSKEWDALGEIDGPRVVELAERQGDRFARAVARFGIEFR